MLASNKQRLVSCSQLPLMLAAFQALNVAPRCQAHPPIHDVILVSFVCRKWHGQLGNQDRPFEIALFVRVAGCSGGCEEGV